MHSIFLHALLVINLAVTVHCETKFTHPGTWQKTDDDPQKYARYKIGEKITVQWVTDLQSVSLAVWQVVEGTFRWSWVKRNVTEPSTIWRVSFGDGTFDENTSGEDTRFWFALYDPETIRNDIADGSPSLVNSVAFNVSLPEDYTTSVQTFKTSTATSKPKDDDDDDDDTTTEPSPTPTQSSDANSGSGSKGDDSGSSKGSSNSGDDSDSNDDSDGDSGLSSGAAAGIAVGATIGGLAILGALGFFLWKRHKKAKDPQYQSPNNQDEAKAELPTGPMYATPPPPLPTQQRPAIYEAPA